MIEHFGIRVQRSGAGGDDANCVGGKSVAGSLSSKFFGTGIHLDRGGIDRAGPVQNGVGRGAKPVEIFVITVTAEMIDGTVGRGDFAIGRHRHVDQHVRSVRVRHRINIESP